MQPHMENVTLDDILVDHSPILLARFLIKNNAQIKYTKESKRLLPSIIRDSLISIVQTMQHDCREKYNTSLNQNDKQYYFGLFGKVQSLSYRIDNQHFVQQVMKEYKTMCAST